MSLSDGIHLVDVNGHDVPDCERDIPEIDGPESWPVCVEYDAIEYTLPHEAIEAMYQAMIDEDCPPDPWPTEEEMADVEAEWDFPRRRQVSPIELAQIAAHGCV